MESSPASGAPTPEQARAALGDVAAARNSASVRARAPWWYHFGIALAIGFAYASFSINRGVVPYAMAIGSALPLAMHWLAARTTGIHRDVYRTTPTTLGPGWAMGGALAAIAVLGALVQWVVGFQWGMAIAGIAAFAATYYYSRKIEDAALDDMRHGR
jgi:hypothetical protein